MPQLIGAVAQNLRVIDGDGGVDERPEQVRIDHGAEFLDREAPSAALLHAGAEEDAGDKEKRRHMKRIDEELDAVARHRAIPPEAMERSFVRVPEHHECDGEAAEDVDQERPLRLDHGNSGRFGARSLQGLRGSQCGSPEGWDFLSGYHSPPPRATSAPSRARLPGDAKGIPRDVPRGTPIVALRRHRSG